MVYGRTQVETQNGRVVATVTAGAESAENAASRGICSGIKRRRQQDRTVAGRTNNGENENGAVCRQNGTCAERRNRPRPSSPAGGENLQTNEEKRQVERNPGRTSSRTVTVTKMQQVEQNEKRRRRRCVEIR